MTNEQLTDELCVALRVAGYSLRRTVGFFSMDVYRGETLVARVGAYTYKKRMFPSIRRDLWVTIQVRPVGPARITCYSGALAGRAARFKRVVARLDLCAKAMPGPSATGGAR